MITRHSNHELLLISLVQCVFCPVFLLSPGRRGWLPFHDFASVGGFFLLKVGRKIFAQRELFDFGFSLMYSCLSLSILVPLCENHQLCHRLHTIHHSRSHCYLVNLPFPSCCFLLLQITPETNLHPHHPVCTLLFSSPVHCPLLWMVEPKYFSSSTFTISAPCLLTFPPPLSGHELLLTDHRSAS